MNQSRTQVDVVGGRELWNIILLLVAQVTAAAIGLSAFRLMGSEFSVAEFGRYGFAASFAMFFGLLADLGTQRIATRDIACAPDRAGPDL